MGMGEPLLNLPAVVDAYHLLNKQVGIGGHYITISTVGERGLGMSMSVLGDEANRAQPPCMLLDAGLIATRQGSGVYVRHVPVAFSNFTIQHTFCLIELPN